MSAFLSKSKYLNGLQCEKLLWYYYNAKKDMPDFSEQTQQIFSAGHEVGEYAKKLYPDGIEIPWDAGFEKVTGLSRQALEKRKPVFEAGFLANNAYARADILVPVNENAWDIIEVKSSTKVKDIYHHDVAFQKRCFENAGLKINKCFIAHINNGYVRQGEIEPEKLFTVEDVTDLITEHVKGVDHNINRFLGVIKGDKPVVQVGAHCSNPYECIMQEICWDFLPEKNIYTLHRLGKKKTSMLVEKGVYGISEIPADFNLSHANEIQVNCDLNNETHIDKKSIRAFLNSLEYPLHLIDFETTMMTPVPLWDNTRPFEKIPFQFSLHVLDSPGAKPKHYEFLANGNNDPRKKLLDRLMHLIHNKGSILAYNVKFEKQIINALCFNSEHKEWAESLTPRYVDLWQPFDKMRYYNPAQKGSTSLKAVLPAVTGKSYSEMEIADGGCAANAFLLLASGNAGYFKKRKTRKALLEYCKLDTTGMIDILRELERLVG